MSVWSFIVRVIFPLTTGALNQRILWLFGGRSPSCFGDDFLDPRATRAIPSVAEHAFDFGLSMQTSPLRPSFFCIRALGSP